MWANERATGLERLTSGYSGRMFLALSIGLVGVKIGRLFLPPILPTVISDLGITAVEAGIALSVLSGFYGLLQFPGGRLADEWTRKTILVIALGTAIVGMVVLSTTRTYTILLIGTAVIGIGEGLYGPADRALLSDIFRRRRGEAFGIHNVSIDVSGVAASGLAIIAVSVLTWRQAFLVPTVIAGTAIVLLHVWERRSTYSIGVVDLRIGHTVRRLFVSHHIRWLLVAYVLFMFTATGVIGFLPTLLQIDHGFSAALASTAFAVLFAAGFLVKPISGRLSDRFPRLLIAGGAFVLSAIGLAVLIVSSSVPAAFLGVAIFAIGLKPFPPVMHAYFMDSFPDGSRAGDFGALRTIGVGFGSLGSTYVGFVASWSGYTLAFAGLAFCLAVSAALVLWQWTEGP